MFLRLIFLRNRPLWSTLRRFFRTRFWKNEHIGVRKRVKYAYSTLFFDLEEGIEAVVLFQLLLEESCSQIMAIFEKIDLSKIQVQKQSHHGSLLKRSIQRCPLRT